MAAILARAVAFPLIYAGVVLAALGVGWLLWLMAHTGVDASAHLLFLESSPDISRLRVFAKLPAFDSSADKAFLASVLTALGAALVSLGVFIIVVKGPQFNRSIPRIGGVIFGYYTTIQAIALLRGDAFWMGFAVPPEYFLTLWIAAAVMIGESIKAATRSEYFRENHFGRVIDAVLTLGIAAFLAICYDAAEMAYFGGLAFAGLTAVSSYLIDAAGRGALAARRAAFLSLSDADEPANASVWQRIKLHVSAYFLTFAEEFTSRELYADIEASTLKLEGPDAEAFAEIIGVFVFWVMTIWIFVVLPAFFFVYWLIWR